MPRPEVFGFISLADNTTLYYFAATLVAAAFWLKRPWAAPAIIAAAGVVGWALL